MEFCFRSRCVWGVVNTKKIEESVKERERESPEVEKNREYVEGKVGKEKSHWLHLIFAREK